ncbi:hypothetical protein DERP_003289 [Dermatophagoides pteronyssinus]|uniref:Ionotropic glutamate receptor L-glutamate and glycine-binding domain-containing protein n=1 Tax=Dermatophagoides pteronyssinus TaxID=6956 RepID=A0ABQ8JJD4_DERPT|nr:hypothetical protein DERP_003289 [Dermatophagoides pteronyssinus]
MASSSSSSLLNLQNQTLRIGINNDPPYTIMDNNRLAGIDLTMIKLISMQFNFTINLVDCDGIFGSKLTNNTWTGMIGKLINNEIDIGIGGIMMTYERFNSLNFLYPYTSDQLTFATIFPKTGINFNLLIQPFSTQVWLCLLLSLILFIIFQELKIYFGYDDDDDDSLIIMTNRTGKKINYHRANIVWVAISLLLSQPYQQLKHMKNLEKFCIIIWIMTSIVIHILYGVSLFATLTIPTRIAIDSVEKLMKNCQQNKIIVIAQQHTSIEEIFLETFPTLYDCMEYSDDDEQALNRLIIQMNYEPNSIQYAVIAYRKTIEYHQNVIGRFYIPPDNQESSILMTWISFPVRNDFQYIKYFDKM